MYLKTRLSDNHLLKFVDLKVLRLSLWLRIDELMCELPVQKRKIFSKNLQDHHQPVRAVAGSLPDLLSAFIAALNERACSALEGPTPLQSFSLHNHFTFRLSALQFTCLVSQSLTKSVILAHMAVVYFSSWRTFYYKECEMLAKFVFCRNFTCFLHTFYSL